MKRTFHPYPNYADSGIPWIGRIPVDWKLTRVGTSSRCLDGSRIPLNSEERGYRQGEIPYWGANGVVDSVDEWLFNVGIVVEPSKYYIDSGVPCLRSLNVKPHRIVGEDLVYISPESNELLAKSKIYLGDLVAVHSGQTGATAIVNERFDGANCIDLIIIRRPQRVGEHFLDYFLNSDLATVQFEMGTAGAIQGHFNISAAASLQIVCPPIPEQRAIVAYLDREIGTLDRLAAKVEQAIGRLQEYRSALITAAVTGKIDVRDYTGN